MFLKYNYPWVLWAIVILALCGVPGSDLPKTTIIGVDKIVHVVIYFIFNFLLMYGFTKQRKSSFLSNNAIFISLIIGVFYGVLIEVLQEHFFIARSGEIGDAIANSLGSIIGVLFYSFSKWEKIIQKNKS